MTHLSKQISGPINVARLEGKINGIDKVLYVFMDWHLGVDIQTECDDLFSPDIQKYFVYSFEGLNKKDKKYDFFFEITPTRVVGEVENYKGKYIREVVKVFRRSFNYDPTSNKVLTSKIFKNVRFHYTDIRDYASFDNIYDSFSNILDYALSMLRNTYTTPNSVAYIINFLTTVSEKVKTLYNIILDIENKKVVIEKQKMSVIKKETNDNEKATLTYILNKTMTKYENENIKKIIRSFIDEEIKTKLMDITNYSDHIKKSFEKYRDSLIYPNQLNKDQYNGYWYGFSTITSRNMLVDIVNKIEILFDKYSNCYARLMDIYFLRRFLDKDYITNGITYSGASHSICFIYVLVKFFDFKITHISYSSEKNLDDLAKKIHNIDFGDEIDGLFYPPTLNQCSDMSKFPDNFA